MIEETSAIVEINRAELDQQIATARQYPRDLSLAVRSARDLATSTVEMAESCFYSLPARKGGSGEITGPSVRLAELLASTWGNLRVTGRVVDEDARFITAEGIAHDLQTNTAYRIEVRRRITTREGRRYSDDMVQVTGAAATSIAIRNAIFRLVPRPIVAQIETECRRRATIDSGEGLDQRVDVVLKRLADFGVERAQVLRRLGVEAAVDITPEQLETLIGLGTAIREGQITAEEAFSDPDADVPGHDPSAAAKQLAASLAAQRAS